MNSGKWTLDADRIKSLLGYAVLAPSSHNTQPWRFEITDGNVSMYADRTRALPVNDPDDRELTISCGCALMNLRVVAAHEDLGVTFDITPDSADDDLFAVTSFGKPDLSLPDEAELFVSIEGRRTYRKRFESKDVPAQILDALSAVASDEGCWLEVVDSEEHRQKIAAVVSEGDAIQWSNPGW